MSFNLKQFRYYCGPRIYFDSGSSFTCFDRSDGYNKNCYSLGNGNYQCYDARENKWEWPNWNERDGTPDNSHLTSIHTDYILRTSPSRRLAQNRLDSVSEDNESEAGTSISGDSDVALVQEELGHYYNASKAKFNRMIENNSRNGSPKSNIASEKF